MNGCLDTRVLASHFFHGVCVCVCVCVCVLATQSCLTLWDPMDSNPCVCVCVYVYVC